MYRKRKGCVGLKNYHLSDDIAFRFSDKQWSEWPLTAEKFTHMIERIPEKNAIINLFMDYETFGEHQPKGSGIFSFLEQLPNAVSKRKDIQFILPSSAIKRIKSKDQMDVMIPISWADQERDLSPWLGNYLQREAFDYVSSLRDKVKGRNNEELSRTWDFLMTSDHLYYMSTKTHNDGHIHQYFSPYKSPYDAFINFMNAVTNLDYQLDRLN